MPTSRIRPKYWHVIKRTMRPEKGVQVGKKFYKYGRNHAFTVSDPVVAREMEKDHAKDVVVAEVDKPKMDVSNSVFAQLPAMPWHKNRSPWWERRKPLKGVSHEENEEEHDEEERDGKPHEGHGRDDGGHEQGAGANVSPRRRGEARKEAQKVRR